MKNSFYVRVGKPCFDFVAASCGLLLLSPLLAPLAVAVKLSSPGPVFFRQVRIGQFGKPFQIFKLRSMRVKGKSASQLTASGDPRITRVGAWLRRSKIDELPQLFNVLCGDMSLVGPRPEVPKFVARYTPAQKGVLDARPGMTGPSANVYEEELLAGLDNKEYFYLHTVMPKKLEIDLNYCRHITFGTDLHVLYRTFAKLLMRVYEPSKNGGHPVDTQFEIHADKE